MASEILVSFEDKKSTIVDWVSALTAIPKANIGRIEEMGKLPYPAAYLDKITETSFHRPVRVSQEIDEQLQSVVYSSKQVRVDIVFVTKDLGDYADVEPENYLEAEYYADGLQGRLYDESSLELLHNAELSLQADGPVRKRDEQREDGWLRKRVIEIAFGYVQVSTEDQYELESVENIKSVSYFGCPEGAPPDCSPQEITVSVTYVKSVDTKTGVVDLTEDYAGLDPTTDKIKEEQALLPDLFEVASEAAQLALDVKQSDICVRTDITKVYVALNNINASLADWYELPFTGGGEFLPLVVVNIETGNYTLAADDQVTEFNNGTNDYDCVVPLNATVPIDIRKRGELRKTGIGEITVKKENISQVFRLAGLGDVDEFKLSDVETPLTYEKTDTDTWLFFGGYKNA